MSEDVETKKRPAFQFYPSDWRKDVELRACSLAARGLWIDLMCVMHDCEPYGHLMLKGAPMTPAKIAGQIGVTPAQVKKLLDELLENGVARQAEDGTIYSKRMVEDERIRNARAAGGKAGSEHGIKGAEHGSKGGRPSTSKGGSETPLEGELKPPPSSSSSSSSSISLSESDPATAVGLVGKAFKRAGVSPTTLNLADPVLLALIAQGATPDEFEGIAREAVSKGIAKPQPWVCTVLQQRRNQAQQLKLVQPTKEAKPWDNAV